MAATVPTPLTLPEIFVKVSDLLNGNLFVLSNILLVIMLVFAGYKRMMAADNPKGVQESNLTIVMAIAGYAVIWLAYFIVKAVGQLLGYDKGIGYTF